MGKLQPTKVHNDNIEILKDQSTLIDSMLRDFVNGLIKLDDFHSCKSLLEIFLSNVIEHGRLIDDDLSYKEKDKEIYYYFLFFYLKKLRLKQVVRDENFPRLILEYSFSNIQKFYDSNMAKESKSIVIKIRDFLTSLNLENN